jgi:hypothetical protein
MKYTHHDNFVNLDDEFDEPDQSDRFEGLVEKDKKWVRKKVWRRTGNGQWEGERGLEVRENEQFTGAGLYLSKRRPGKRLTSFEEADLIRAYRAGDRSAGDRLTGDTRTGFTGNATGFELLLCKPVSAAI